MKNQTQAIQVKNVTHAYKENSKPVLDQVNFHVDKGEFCTILGRSGAGKSTFLRTMNGFIYPQQGEIFIEGQKLVYRARELRKIRNKVAMVFQHYNLVNRLSVLENVLCGMLHEIPFGRGLIGVFTEEEKKFAMVQLEKVGLADFAHKRADQLSGGQKQRVGIARALAQKPEIILADEPVASLDPITALEIMEILKEINGRENITIIVSLHQINLSREFGKRIIGFSNGKIVVDKTEAQLTDFDLKKIYDNLDGLEKRHEKSTANEKSII
ncbi:phosphonate ABC transporter ATP-binding protein [Pseudobacillus badius]|uniref:phosphonate ABC transporter ATP-binding protein n=1 Tax=Bacillus badius TaxID=1455 RepID=UPI001CC14287|nr:phosphonate ABC transporter ATP-binding protein [Bacillus badius]UAT32419.1 phosphonate ABC transporter ATP-binding protein [Bacillus badius]GLY12895.1 phosphonates import ATP-binding protein PhnC [Bacillus badius]